MSWGSSSGASASSSSATFSELSSHTSDYSMDSADFGKVFDNTGASGTVILTLPDPTAAAAPITVMNSTGDTLRVLAKAGHQIFQNGLSTSTAGSIQSKQKGQSVTLKGNGSHWIATPNGALPWQIDQIALDQSWLFNSTGDYAQNTSMSAAALALGSGELTLCFWLRPIETWSAASGIFAATDASKGMLVATQNPSVYGWMEIYLLVYFSGSSARWNITNTGALSQKSWACVVITYDGSSTSNDPKFYVNGQATHVNEAVAPVGTMVPTVQGWVVGSDQGKTAPAQSNIFQVAAWDAILTREEISNLSKMSFYLPCCAVRRDDCVFNYTMGGHASDDVTSVLKNVVNPGTDDLTVTGMTSAEVKTGNTP